ncbi:putative oxidoreductase, partial [Blakeslea trispora]
DLSGKVAIITGSNSGIGKETALILASAGAKVIIPCRTLEKAKSAIKDIQKSESKSTDLIPMQLDLSDLSSVQLFANHFFQLNLPLHILIANAGVSGGPRRLTRDGFEIHFGVNHLGHFYLTSLLMDKLRQSAPSRVVVLSSGANRQFLSSKGLDFKNLNSEKNYSATEAYSMSKLSNILFAKELQRRFDAEGSNVIVTSVHPGVVKSNIFRNLRFIDGLDLLLSIKDFSSFLSEIATIKSVKIGASTSVYCAVSPHVVKGEFYANNKINRNLLNHAANDPEMAKRLWQVSENLIKSALTKKSIQ